jgi:hypothetical protein
MIQQLREAVRQFMLSERMPADRLARRAGMSPGKLGLVLNSGRDLTLHEFVRLADTIGLYLAGGRQPDIVTRSRRQRKLPPDADDQADDQPEEPAP